MDLKNEPNQKQIQRSAVRKGARSQTLKAETHSPNKVVTENTNVAPSSPETDSRHGKEVVVDEIEDVVGDFIQGKENRADEYIEIIGEMMGRYDDYGYAQQTLLGILDYIEENNNITDRQVEAVENIRNKPSRKDRYGW